MLLRCKNYFIENFMLKCCYELNLYGLDYDLMKREQSNECTK